MKTTKRTKGQLQRERLFSLQAKRVDVEMVQATNAFSAAETLVELRHRDAGSIGACCRR